MGTTTQGILINPLGKVGLISKNTTGLLLWHIPCMTPECGCWLAIAFSTLGPSIIGRSTTVEINVFINIWVLRKMGYFSLLHTSSRKLRTFITTRNCAQMVPKRIHKFVLQKRTFFTPSSNYRWKTLDIYSDGYRVTFSRCFIEKLARIANREVIKIWLRLLRLILWEMLGE